MGPNEWLKNYVSLAQNYFADWILLLVLIPKKIVLSFSGHVRYDVFVSGKNLIASVEAKPSSIYELYV